MNDRDHGGPGSGCEPERDRRTGRSRRAVLGALGAALAAGVAGCTGSGDGSDDGGGGGSQADDPTDGSGNGEPTDGSGNGDPETDATTDPTTGTDDGEDGTADDGSDGEATTGETTGDLDLREANVTGVEFEGGDGQYRFSVTLFHDDEGEDGYANWWQVEDAAGERLGRRDLLHAHGTREFTRSATVEVPDDAGTVVVRGHDQTHGYGGQAAVVDLGAGTVEFVRQGSDPVDLPRLSGN